MPHSSIHIPNSKIRNPQSAIRNRKGLSLLEVLVSMFIMLFGLLGVAAMFPAGKYHVSKAAQYDSAAAVGQAAFNDIIVRGLLNEHDWRANDGVATPIALPVQFDPLISDHPATIGTMRRVTNVRLKYEVGTNPPGFTADLVERAAGRILEDVFQSQDGIILDTEGTPASGSRLAMPPPKDDEPVRLVYHDDLLRKPSTFNTEFYRPDFNGRYTWMFTAVPSGTNSEQLRVSVAVFDSRLRDSEATYYDSDTAKKNVDAKIQLRGGIGGGQLRLQWPMPRVGGPPADTFTADETLVAPGNWIVVSGGNDGGYRWFRVVSQERVNNVDQITIAGPDIRPPQDDDPPFQVSVFDTVVAVYEKTVQRYDSTSWSWGD